MLDPLLRSSYPWTLDMLTDAIEYYVFGEYYTEWCIHQDI